MNKYSLLLSCLLYSSVIWGQQKRVSKLKLPAALPPVSSNCMRISNLTTQKRLENYPFNTATSIEFVSIKVDTIPKDEYKPIKYDGLPVVEDPNFSDYLNERKKTDTKTIEELTDIIYNLGYNPKLSRPPIVSKGCYQPRNAILFLDEKGKIFAYIEICFHCGNIRLSSDKIQFGDLCIEKLRRVKELFQNSGIEYGTIYTY